MASNGCNASGRSSTSSRCVHQALRPTASRRLHATIVCVRRPPAPLLHFGEARSQPTMRLGSVWPTRPWVTGRTSTMNPLPRVPNPVGPHRTTTCVYVVQTKREIKHRRKDVGAVKDHIRTRCAERAGCPFRRQDTGEKKERRAKEAARTARSQRVARSGRRKCGEGLLHAWEAEHCSLSYSRACCAASRPIPAATRLG